MSPRGKICVLSFFFALCLSGALFTAWQQALNDANVRPSDLFSVVDHQLDDFRGGNFSRAYESASSGVQEQFSEEQYTAMVQAEYPAMMRVSRAQYGQVLTKGRHATIEVFLIAYNGEVMPCVYMLVREGDSWHIDGARMMQAWPPDSRMEGTIL